MHASRFFLATLLVIASLFLSFTFADPIDFRICMDKPTVNLKKLDFSPLTPKKGDNVTVQMFGDAVEGAQAGQLVTKVYYKGAAVYEYKYDLCEVSVNGCPIGVGPWAGKLNQAVPKLALAGNYTAKTIAFNGDKQYVCVEFDFSVIRA